MLTDPSQGLEGLRVAGGRVSTPLPSGALDTPRLTTGTSESAGPGPRAAEEDGRTDGPIPSRLGGHLDTVRQKEGRKDAGHLGSRPNSATGLLCAFGQVSSHLWASVSLLVKQELNDL